MNNRKYYWNGTKSELIELCYALYTSKRIEDYDRKNPSFIKLCKVIFAMFGLICPINPCLRICQMRKRKKLVVGCINHSKKHLTVKSS